MSLDRREFLGLGAAGIAGAITTSMDRAAEAAIEPPTPAGPRVITPSLNIRDYLSVEAQRITNSALRGLKDPEAFAKLIPERRRQYMEMMGLADLQAADKRSPVPVHITGKVDRPSFTIEKLHYESLPNLHVTANLYVPKAKPEDGKMPAVLYVCGHAEKQKVHYQAHPRRFAELGFVCLIVETVQLGEATGYHHGCYREGWFHWYSRGYSPAAVELLNGIRGLDLLAARPEVDADKLGVTGISGGGAATWWIAAGDERIKAAAPVCGTATLGSHIYDRTIDGHCDCMWWPNSRLWDLADVGALIAPRPLLIASADRDGIFTIQSIRTVFEQLQALYKMIGNADKIKLVETPGGHSYHSKSRTAIFSWFMKHLMGKEVTPEHVGDVEETPAKQETEETLRVYVQGPPANNRVATIQDEFIKLPAPPTIGDGQALGNERRRVREALSAGSFGAFPSPPPALDVTEEYYLDGGTGTRFAYTPEAGWRLHGKKMMPREAMPPVPAIIALRMAGEDRNGAESVLNTIRAPWAKIVIEPRGSGETSWSEEQQWHLRRASAWTGRTLAGMWTLDIIRGLEAARLLDGVQGDKLSLAAKGEMCVPALYAALLDGRVSALFLDSPPATQNAPSRADGKGPAIEILNCLRVTDLPQVAGLLYPCELVIVNAPETYAWADKLYNSMSPKGRFRRVNAFEEWKPNQA